MQDVTEKIEQHKDIIDANNKSFYEMKKTKDAKQNERKYVGGLSYILSPLSFCAGLLSVVRSRGQRNRFFYSSSTGQKTAQNINSDLQLLSSRY